MSGGFLRQHLIRRIPVVILLAALAGCSTLFGPKPAPETEQPVAPPELPASEAPAPASAPEAASAPAVEPQHEATEAKHPAPKKPIVRQPPPKREPAVPAPPPAPPAPVPPPIITTRLLSQEQTRALLDTKVQRPDGKIIGRAIDVFVDANGKPQSMLVNLSGFLGIGDRKVRFPWSEFRFGAWPKKSPITLDLGPNEPPAAETAKAHAKEAPKEAPKEANGKPATASEPLTLAVIDATVARRNGDRVGRIIDILVDGSAQPQAAVLDVGGLIGKERPIAADWSALHFVTRNNEVELQMELSDAQIKAAPPYSTDAPVRAVSPAPAVPHVAAPVAPRSGAASGLASAARTQR